ncbi:MAG: hypothetical protein V7L14_12080 [Nostoc sp.]|uniref:hypothetical protein n=1 Tax=Nostoc sp. TaxID=1180 RepID=UPI002FFB4D5B
MPIYRKRYANNWDEIALAIKQAAQLRCPHCGQKCLRQEREAKGTVHSERDSNDALGTPCQFYA